MENELKAEPAPYLRERLPISMELVSELGQNPKVKARGTRWDVKNMDVAIAGLGWFYLSLPKAISEAIVNSSKLEGQKAREKNPSEETMQLS
ncbi:hypothetical protein KY284_020049 [Solanum tuberosum]|nr:hypothetical protein KY284_020049 [Solanum tuberosum]